MQKLVSLTVVLAIVATMIVGCGAAEPETIIQTVEVEKRVTEVVKETIRETVIVEGTPQVVEKEVTKVVTQKETVVVEKVVEKVVTSTPTPVPTKGPIEKEAPMLASKVSSGELPPVGAAAPPFASPKSIAPWYSMRPSRSGQTPSTRPVWTGSTRKITRKPTRGKPASQT